MVAVFTPAASLQEITSDAAAPNNELLGKDDVRLPTDPATKTGTLQVGEVVTGGTSTETGTVVRIGPDTSFVDVRAASGVFNAAEVLTGTTSGAVVTTNGAPTVPDPNAFRTGKRGVLRV
jgi:hypothetical protein